MDKKGTGRIEFETFEEFINESDLDEALALITGSTGPHEIDVKLDQSKFVDPSEIAQMNAQHLPVAGEIKFRDYNQDVE